MTKKQKNDISMPEDLTSTDMPPNPMLYTFRGHEWGPNNSTDINLIDAFEVKQESSHKIWKNVHPFWVLDYANYEGCTVRAGSSHSLWKERPKGRLHFYKPYTTYWEDLRSVEHTIHSIYLRFSGTMPAGIEALFKKNKSFVAINDPNKKLVSLMQQASDIGQCYGDNGFYKAQACLYQIIDMLLCLDKETPALFTTSEQYRFVEESELVANVREFLRQNCHKFLTLDEIAQKLGISTSSLTHKFKIETGITPIQMHEQFRMAQIRRMLLRGEFLKVIAPMMGFNDIYHLSRYFKRIEGLSPREFRKRAMEENPFGRKIE